MIPTPPNFPKLDILASVLPDFASVCAARALPPFDESIVALLQDMSRHLLQEPLAKDYPDVVAFAFWCRKGALHQLRERYVSTELRLGRGLVFHIAPGNVPVNFAYSLVAGLLAGNANIVRLPSREYPQVSMICDAFTELLATYEHLRHHLAFIRYERDKAITDLLSAHCDVRIIWGGDRAIHEIRQSPMPERAFDVTFADRYSLCVIDAAAYLGATDTARIAQDFYNDTYLFDQNACTAPHLIVWLGLESQIKAAKSVFWGCLHKVVGDKYSLPPVAAVNKLSDAYHFAAQAENCHFQPMDDNLIVRIELKQLEPGLEEWRSTSGCFFEFDAVALSDILPIINRKFQTLAYYGVDRTLLERFVMDHRPSGIDRIVPIGRTLDFSLIWDGYDLIGTLSRVVSVI